MRPRRHPVSSADTFECLGDAVFPALLYKHDAEVTKDQLAMINKDVWRLDVTMNGLRFVKLGNTLDKAPKSPQGFKRPALELILVVVESAALIELRDHPGSVNVGLDKPQHIWMTDSW